MCRIIAIVVAAVLTLYSTCAALNGLFATTWFTGPTFSVGIGTHCVVTDQIEGFCTDYSWDAFANDTEKAMAGLLIASAILGMLCFCVMVFNILFACCCINLAGPMTGILATLQGACMATVCILMGFYYKWELPHFTDSIGWAYIFSIAAVPCSFIAAALTSVHSHSRYEQRGSVIYYKA